MKMKKEIKELAEWVLIINTKVETINKRTKAHTIYIKRLEKELKELRKGK